MYRKRAKETEVRIFLYRKISCRIVWQSKNLETEALFTVFEKLDVRLQAEVR